MNPIQGIIDLLKTAGNIFLKLWSKKNDPSVPQRDDQIAADYDRKRQDLNKR